VRIIDGGVAVRYLDVAPRRSFGALASVPIVGASFPRYDAVS
jgi:hypothetical protein